MAYLGSYFWKKELCLAATAEYWLKKLFKIVGNNLLRWLQECYVLIKVNNKYLITSIFLREDPEKLIHWLKSENNIFSHTLNYDSIMSKTFLKGE